MDFLNFEDNSNEGEEDIKSWWIGQIYVLFAGILCGILANMYFFKAANCSNTISNLIKGNGFQSTKMVLIIRTDLGMTKGKIASQCAHAAIICYKKALKQDPEFLNYWETSGQMKVTLKVSSEEELDVLYNQAKSKGIITGLVRDAGRTQVQSYTKTVLGLGPAPETLLNTVSGDLKLY